MANQQAPACPAASRSRFRPDLETNKTAGGARGSGGPSLCSATLNWSLGRAGNPGGIALSPLQCPTPKPWPGLGLRLRKPAPPRLPQLHARTPRAPSSAPALRSPASHSPQLPLCTEHHAPMLWLRVGRSTPAASYRSNAAIPAVSGFCVLISRSPAHSVPHPGAVCPFRISGPLSMRDVPLPCSPDSPTFWVPGRCPSGIPSRSLGLVCPLGRCLLCYPIQTRTPSL